jgi:hypothetical protein
MCWSASKIGASLNCSVMGSFPSRAGAESHQKGYHHAILWLLGGQSVKTVAPAVPGAP